MATPRETARQELLRRLLEKYERSRRFGQPGPWRQDVIVRIDSRQFPEAFHPDARESLADLRAAAEALASAGAVRLVCHRSYAEAVPHELRLGSGELAAAYGLAAAAGFTPLGEGLAALTAHLRRLRAQPSPPWMDAFLARVEAGGAAADLSPVGMQRDRFKREQREILDALTAAAALAAGASGWERVVSERLFGDSKRLPALRFRVIDLLVRADPRWAGVPPEDAADLLEAYGVRRKPGLLRCAGCGTLTIAGRTYRLEDFTPTAHLPDAWADAWVDALSTPRTLCITTVENEYPFLAYVEEAGGPAGLGARGEVAVYTAGFPSPALVEALAQVARRTGASFQHWGDADLGGLRIWWLLRARLERPVTLFRTTADWLRASARRGGTPLGGAEREGLARFRAELLASPVGAAPDVLDARALAEALMETGVRIEQERY